jgi:acylphosphatase
MKTARQIHYSGRVQGVGFRYSVKQIASGYEVTGWVRNLPDGRVELTVQGDHAEIEAFLDAIGASHLRTHIKERMESELHPIPAIPSQFEIRH